MTTTAERLRARKSILYGSAGTIVEWYDYGLYLYLLKVTSELFFPSDNPILSAMASLGVFAAGSVMRVVGGVFSGRIGDRFGRKKALVMSILFMSIPLGLTAFLPTYAMIGIWAPILFTIMRLLQGFSAGGEYSGTIVQLVEQAPPNRRGFVAGTAVFTSGIGILLASLLVTILTTWLSPEAMSSWGWRVGYLVGGVLGLFALIMRRNMDETVAFEAEVETNEVPAHPFRFAITKLPGAVTVAAILAGYGGILYYLVIGLLPTILDSMTEVQSDVALWVTTSMTIVYAFATPFFAGVSDRYGRRRTLVWATIGFIVLSVPMFLLMTHDGIIIVGMAGYVLLALLMLYTGPVVAAVGEQFPSQARYTALATGYNLGNAILGGTAPLIGTALIAWFDTPIAPSYYIVVVSIIVLPMLLRLRETSGMSLTELDEGHPRAETEARPVVKG